MTTMIRVVSCFLVLTILGACSSKPVRHLASDASLVKAGVSTKEDVLTYLGDPDSQQMISATSERWVYNEERQSAAQKVPFLGKMFSSKNYSRIVVTFEGENVVEVRFSSFDSDEFDWSDDYSWQEKRQ
ncbi:MAG: hypothetical protein KJP19_04615 [Deltaproteobacteria bacterium]|nr:hypothetical protein [Deltaproteobacteria bacterium]